MNDRIELVIIQYLSGKRTEISSFDLKRLEELSELMSLIERAERVYNSLKPVFGEQKK